MPYQWRVEQETTKGELENLSEQYSSDYDPGLSPEFRFGFGVGAIVLGLSGIPFLIGLGALYGYSDLTLSYFESRIEAEFEEEMDKLEGKPDSTRVEVQRKYSYTGKQGGHWLPTSDFRVVVVI